MLDGEYEATYAPIDLRSLPLGRPLIFDVYLCLEGRFALYRKAPSPFVEANKAELQHAGLRTLWVRQPKQDSLISPQQLAEVLALPDEQVPPLAKSGLFYDSALAIASRTITHSITKPILADVRDLVGITVGYLARHPSALESLVAVMRTDFSVYAHSVNVAVYALALARQIGVVDNQQLRDLGLGAFLHDVGKAKVPSEILGKPGPLSDSEWTTMRNHPVWGEELLALAEELPETAIRVVKQHHERLDGSGYPTGIGAANLPWYSNLIAIVDSVDAMTSDRPYRARKAAQEALQELLDVGAGKLDRELLTVFSRFLSGAPLDEPTLSR